MKLDDVAFLARSIYNEMPVHGPAGASIPYSFKQFPKNLMDESHVVHGRFLDKHLCYVEDAMKVLPKHSMDWVLSQSIKYHRNSDILNHDGIFSSISPYLVELPFLIGTFNIKKTGFVGALQNLIGPDLECGTPTDGNSTGFQGAINTTTVAGTVGKLYDRIALNISSAAGNERLAVYSDSSGPNTIQAEVGSTVSANGFNWRSVTEFDLDTATTWIAMQVDSASNNLFFKNTVARAFKVQAFGAFTTGGFTQDTGQVLNMKIGHS